jgi:hypothetical protein
MFTLDQVVPWGRSFDEYRRMFALSDVDLGGSLLGCADGPASFNAEAASRGLSVTSCDPIYRFSADEIARRIAETAPRVIDEARRNRDAFVWDTIASVDELFRMRQSAMRRFLEDFESGRKAGRYVDAELPTLPFPRRSFELALCSHFLFLYSEQLSVDFHRASVAELCRVAFEVRIFPVLALDGRLSPWVEPVADERRGHGSKVSLELVPYEFQRGGNQMLRIRNLAP